MRNNDLFPQIVEMVIRHRGHFKRKLTRADRLGEDLGMDGADAEAFLQDYGKNFNVDLSGMRIEEYFSNEGFSPVVFLKYILKKNPHKPVTLGDLEKFALHGKWLNE